MNVLVVGFDTTTHAALRLEPWAGRVHTFAAYKHAPEADLHLPGRGMYNQGLRRLAGRLPAGWAPKSVIDDVAQRGLWWSSLALDRPGSDYQPNLRDHYDTFRVLADGFYTALKRWQVDLIIFSNIPHESGTPILFEVARTLSIPTVMCLQSQFPNRFFLATEPSDVGNADEPRRLFGPIENALPSELSVPFYMRSSFWKRARARAWSVRASAMSLRHASAVSMLAHRAAMRMHAASASRDSKHAAAARYRPRDFDGPYAYFPLHLDPEMTTVPLGGALWNQLDALESLADALPDGWSILVKENPKQTGYARGAAFWLRLDRVRRARLAPKDADSFRLIQGSKLVATVTGTAGWEGLLTGVPVVHFGHAWYRSLPGAWDGRVPSTLKSIESIAGPERVPLEAAFRELSKTLGTGVVDLYYAPLTPNFSRRENGALVARSVSRFISAVVLQETTVAVP